MELSHVIASLNSRAYPFNLLRAKLDEQGLLPHHVRGWDKLKEMCKASQLLDNSLWKKTLTEIFVNHVRYGIKVVIMYPLNAHMGSQLINQLKSLDYSDSPYQQSYPLPLPTNVIKKLSKETQTTFEFEDDTIGRLVFCGKRVVRTQDSLLYDQLSPDLRRYLEQQNTVEDAFEKLVFVRKQIIQSFDSILINPNEDRLELHIDIPDLLGVRSSLEIIQSYTYKLQHLLESVPNARLENPMNFFPRIAKLYQEEDGYISQLDHTVDTDSTKKELMRKKGCDLRTENFHQQGLKAVGDHTNPYSIVKAWNTKIGGERHPELKICGSISDAVNLQAVINHATVNGQGNKEDFEMLISKLI